MKTFEGLYVATLTPFDPQDRLDIGVLRAHIRFLVSHGVKGICPCGTTGEFLYLTLAEKVRIVEEAVRAAEGRAAVIAGCWALRPAEIRLLARAAEDAGADAVFLPPPIYYPADDSTIERHYAVAREACSLPVFAYNIPAYAANTVSADCLERMLAGGIIAGVKDSSARSERMQELVSRFGERMRVFAASDSFATEARQIGAHGFISALANVYPAEFLKLWDGAAGLQEWVDALRTAVKKSGGIVAIKHLATRRGFPFGEARVPSSPLGEAQLGALAEVAAPPAVKEA